MFRAARLAGLEDAIADLEGTSFRQFIERVFTGFVWYKYRELIVSALQDFIDGKLLLPDGSRADKIYIALKTQTGKSTFLQLFAAYLAVTYPGIIQGSAMHNDNLVKRFSRMVRSFVENSGTHLVKRDVKNWTTAEGSEFWASPKGSHPSGLPAHVIYGDDLLGGAKEALSENVAGDDIEWLTSELLKRRSPHPPEGLQGRFLEISIGTRWSLGDAQAYWLSRGNWYCIILPTVLDDARWPRGVPVGPFNIEGEDPSYAHKTWQAPNCTIAPDWRKQGEALEPSHPDHTVEAFESSRRINGPPGYLSEARIASIEQQCPKPEAGGGIMDRSWFTKLRADEVPTDGYAKKVRAYDFGVTAGGGDPTTSCKMGRHDTSHIILDGCRAWLSAAGSMQLVAALMILDGNDTTVVVPVGKSDEGRRSLAGMRSYLRQVADWADVPCSPVRGKSVSNRGKPENFISPKHQRCAYPGGSLADDAVPADWEGPEKPFQVPGSVQVAMGRWTPDFREIVKDFEAKAGRHPELRRIEEFARAATGQMAAAQIKALNVDPLPHQDEMIEECHCFSGLPGGLDNYVDAMADAKTAVGRSTKWGIKSYD